MRSEQVYWVFTVSVDRMDKFKPLIPKLVAATEKERGALQFEFNVGTDPRSADSDKDGFLSRTEFQSMGQSDSGDESSSPQSETATQPTR